MTINYNPSLNDIPQSDPFWKDVQEAESRRYAVGFMILPLQSGRVAVLGPMRSLHAICDTVGEVIEAALTIPKSPIPQPRTKTVRDQGEELSKLLGL